MSLGDDLSHAKHSVEQYDRWAIGCFSKRVDRDLRVMLRIVVEHPATQAIIDTLDDGHDGLSSFGCRESHQKVLVSKRCDQQTKRPFVIHDGVSVVDQTRCDVVSNAYISVPGQKSLDVLVMMLMMRD